MIPQATKQKDGPFCLQPFPRACSSFPDESLASDNGNLGSLSIEDDLSHQGLLSAGPAPLQESPFTSDFLHLKLEPEKQFVSTELCLGSCPARSPSAAPKPLSGESECGPAPDLNHGRSRS